MKLIREKKLIGECQERFHQRGQVKESSGTLPGIQRSIGSHSREKSENTNTHLGQSGYQNQETHQRMTYCKAKQTRQRPF